MKIEKGKIYQDIDAWGSDPVYYKILSNPKIKDVVKVQNIKRNKRGQISWMSRNMIKRRWVEVPKIKASLLFD